MTENQLNNAIGVLLKNNPNKHRAKRNKRNKKKDCIKANKRGDYYFSNMYKYHKTDEDNLNDHLNHLYCKLEIEPFKEYIGSTDDMISNKLLKYWYGFKSFTQEWIVPFLPNPHVYGIYETGYKYKLTIQSTNDKVIRLVYEWKEKGIITQPFECAFDDYDQYSKRLGISLDQIKQDFISVNRTKYRVPVVDEKLNEYYQIQDRYFDESRWYKKEETLSTGRTKLRSVLKECALYKEDNDLLSHKKDVFRLSRYAY